MEMIAIWKLPRDLLTVSFQLYYLYIIYIYMYVYIYIYIYILYIYIYVYIEYRYRFRYIDIDVCNIQDINNQLPNRFYNFVHI